MPPESGAAGQELPALEEPLDEAPPPQLTPGEVVASATHTYRIARCLRNAYRENLYEVEIDSSRELAWLHEASSGSDVAERLKRAADFGAALPDVRLLPAILEAFDTLGSTYLVREPTPGVTLSETLTGETAMPLDAALVLLCQLASGVAEIHNGGWVHLDVCPENIVMGERGQPARLLHGHRAARIGDRLVGSAVGDSYVAPEVVAGGPVDERADVYSIGVVLYRLATGRPIEEWGVDPAGAPMENLVGGIPQLLERCLSCDPDGRYMRIEALHTALKRMRRRLVSMPAYTIAGATDIGVEPTRRENEDSYGWLSGALDCESGHSIWAVLCVADGVGGAEAGEEASAAAVRSLLSSAAAWAVSGTEPSASEQAHLVRQWVGTANDAVLASLGGLNGGSTLLAAFVVGSRLAIGHVGDCRLYLLRQDEVRLLTRDHSYAMSLVLQGEADASSLRTHPDRNTITRSLGARQELPDYYVDGLDIVSGSPTLRLSQGDVLVLCSDGCWEAVTDPEIGSAVVSCEDAVGRAAHMLVSTALMNGSRDNVTAVLLRAALVDSPRR